MRVKIKKTEQNRFTWYAQDYSPGDQLEIPDAYAQEYVDKGYVEEVKKAQKKSAKKASSK
jgi:hypothetical protein